MCPLVMSPYSCWFVFITIVIVLRCMALNTGNSNCSKLHNGTMLRNLLSLQLNPLKLILRHLFKNSWFNYNLLCSRLPCKMPDFEMVKHWLVFNMYIRISYKIYWFIYIVLSCTDPYTCSLHPETGICQAAFRRYFYNVNTRSCQVFTYGGCGGNDNRFNTIEECNRMCSTS